MTAINKNHLLIFILLLVVSIILYFKRAEYRTEIDNLFINAEIIERDGVKLNDLRTRWDNKNNRESILKYLENIVPKGKTRKTANKISYQFEAMSKADFDQHIKKIFQSSTEVIRLNVEKIDDFNMSFGIELEVGR